MGTRALRWMWLLLLLSSVAQAQRYPYFQPGGALGAIDSTHQTVNLASGGTYILNILPQANILTCAANQIVYDNASAQLTCQSGFTWTDSTGTLALNETGPAVSVAWKNLNGHTDQKGWAWRLDSAGNNDKLHFGLTTDAGFPNTIASDALFFLRNGVDSGFCQQGVASASALCFMQLSTITTNFLMGPVNGTSSPALPGFRLRCVTNNSCLVTAGEHLAASPQGSTGYYVTSNGPGGRIGMLMEVLAPGQTSAASGDRPPQCSGLSVTSSQGYLCYLFLNNTLFWQMCDIDSVADGRCSSPISQLLAINKVAGTTQVSMTWGESSNANSVTNITAGSAANTQANGVPIDTGNVGTTGSIGGGALAAGACTSGTVSITGLTTGMDVHATPATYPGDGFWWEAYASAAGTATVKVCAATAGTPTASVYNVRVIQ